MIHLTFRAIELSRTSTHVSIPRQVCILTCSVVQAWLEKVTWTVGNVAEGTRRSQIGTRRREKICSTSSIDVVRGNFSANH